MDEYFGKYEVFFNIFVSLRKFDTVLRNMDPGVKIAWFHICQIQNNLNQTLTPRIIEMPRDISNQKGRLLFEETRSKTLRVDKIGSF